MSLSIYFEGLDTLPDLPVERDAEVLFKRVRLTGCDYDRSIISGIELGSYLDEFRFTDRFGVALYKKSMSTGTKAALSLYHFPDVIVSGAELGYNALTETIKFCKNGHLLLAASNFYIEGEIDDWEIDVVCKGRKYTSLNEFAKYLMEVAPYDD